ncbi:rSAM-modified peptide [Flavobacterium piscisymbiosum]|uniref:RSAM-modified peptide n=1 Tax=Flavobacterium piscisymbiosum TaxID=2893753 RepID=A0ABS8MDF4_9FLAO|nr:rSAM-modified peptide [Flavobacterium sp. F-30]MCC9062765.1 rSAM-modified peptide [Flavobacterium sp. F-30]
MTNQALKFADFEKEKLSKNQQKTIQGGDDVDPSKGEGKGATVILN